MPCCVNTGPKRAVIVSTAKRSSPQRAIASRFSNSDRRLSREVRAAIRSNSNTGSGCSGSLLRMRSAPSCISEGTPPKGKPALALDWLALGPPNAPPPGGPIITTSLLLLEKRPMFQRSVARYQVTVGASHQRLPDHLRQARRGRQAQSSTGGEQ